MVVFLKEMYLKNVFTGVVLHVSIRIMDHGYEREEKKVNERNLVPSFQHCHGSEEKIDEEKKG